MTVDLRGVTVDTAATLYFDLLGFADVNSSVTLDDVRLLGLDGSNQPPIAGAGDSYTIDEGDELQLDASGSFDPDGDPLTYSWDISGDGIFADASGITPTLSWQQLQDLGVDDDGNFTVTVRVDDGQSSPVDASTVLTVLNTPPEADAGGPYTIGEGDDLVLAGSGSDVSGADNAILTYRWDLNGDGIFGEAIGAAATVSWAALGALTPPVNNDGSYTVTLRVSDGDTFTDAATSLTVNNVAPTASLSNDGPVAEGSTATVSFNGQTDPSEGDTDAGFLYSYDFNNDGTFEIIGDRSPSATLPAAQLDDGPGTRIVRGRIADKDGGFTDYFTVIAISNVAPTITLNGLASVDEGSPYTLNLGPVTDPGADTVTDYIVRWGDGRSDSYASSGDVTHTYSDGPASPIIVVDLVDEDGTHVAAGSLAVTVRPPGECTLLCLAPDPFLSGVARFDTGAMQADVQYAVSQPGQFFEPGQDPSAGDEWVYAYQILVNQGTLTNLTVGRSPDQEANSLTVLPNSVATGTPPDLQFVGANSVVVSFFSGLAADSRIYVYTSPNGPAFMPATATDILSNVDTEELPSPSLRMGDMDFDGDTDFDDIDAFVLGLTDPTGYETIYGVAATLQGDTDYDRDLDFDDIDGLVTILLQGANLGASAATTPTSMMIDAAAVNDSSNGENGTDLSLEDFYQQPLFDGRVWTSVRRGFRNDRILFGPDEDFPLGSRAAVDPSRASTELVDHEALRAITAEWNSRSRAATPGNHTVRHAGRGMDFDEPLDDDFFRKLGDAVLDDHEDDDLSSSSAVGFMQTLHSRPSRAERTRSHRSE